MAVPRSVRPAAVTATVLAAVAAVVTAYTGAVLAGTYRPGAPGAPTHLLPPQVARSVVWVDRHRVASVVLLALVVVAAVLVAGAVVAGRVRRGAPVVAAMLVAVVAALGTALTHDLVLFDQLALRQVTVGTDLDGFWTAAFDEQVRFVLVGGTEVSRRAYATAVVVHLAAPVVAGAALSAVAIGLVRSGGEPAAPEPDQSA